VLPRSVSRPASFIVHVLVILMLVFGMVVLYRVTYVVLLSLGAVAAAQMYGVLTRSAPPRPKTE